MRPARGCGRVWATGTRYGSHAGSRTGDELVVLVRGVEAGKDAHGLVDAFGVARAAAVQRLLAAKIEQAKVPHKLAPTRPLVQLAVVNGEHF